MRSLSKKQVFSKKLFSFFTNTAINSSSQCNEVIWQQAKVPKCLLKREINEAKNQN